MPVDQETSGSKDSGSKNLPAIRGLDYGDTIASELPALAAGLVHEVKNPLAAIHLHLQLLEGYMSDVEDAELRHKMLDKVGILKREILGLNQILQNFIRLIRPEPRSPGVFMDLNALVREIVEFMEPQASREGIDLRFEPEEPGDQGVSGESGVRNTDQANESMVDPAFIKQILINLILNSIQAFQRSHIPGERRRIVVSAGRRSPYRFVRVADTGPGIPDEVLNRIFDPFFSTKKEGSGLGLAIVKKMILEMGGHVDVHSRPGEGTEFTIFFGGPRRVEEGSP